jgi:hypothetical protein
VQQWRSYFGNANREVCLVSFCMVLLCVKVLLMALIPDQAGWVSTRLLAAKYKQDKLHANEMSHAQATDALKIEREHNKRRLSKLKAGVQQADLLGADAATAAAAVAGKQKVL